MCQNALRVNKSSDFNESYDDSRSAQYAVRVNTKYNYES